MTDDVWYNRWTWGIAIAILSFGAVFPVSGIVSIRLGALVTAITGLVALAYLLVHGIDQPLRRGHPIPNGLTASRGVAGVALLIVVATGSVGGNDRESLILFALLAVVETTDFFDGRLARRHGVSRFGGVWDMENDAFFTFSLSYAAWTLHSFPLPVLLIGSMRYLYFVLVRAQGDPPSMPGWYRFFAKSVAATLVIVLIGSFLVVLPFWLRVTAMWIALVLQLVSFGSEFLFHRRSRRSGRSRRSRSRKTTA